MLLYLREPPVRFLWCCCSSFHFWSSFCCCSSFVDVLIHIFFSTSSLTLPWTIAWFLHPFYTFSPAHRRVIRDNFIFNYSVIFLPRALRPWVGIFYSQAFFTLCSFTNILNLRLSRFPWEPAVLPWSLKGFILILETQTRPICLFDSQ